MDLERIKSILVEYCKARHYNFEFKEDEKKIIIRGNFNFESIDAIGYCSFNYFKSGLALFDIMFDDIDATDEVCQLLNEFNTGAFLLTATADECLILEHTVYILHEEDLVRYTDAVIAELSDEDTVNGLTPLLALTK